MVRTPAIPNQLGFMSRGVKRLHPAYFGLVMATGIVAISSGQQGFHLLALALSWFNVLAYVVLLGMTLFRLLRYSNEFFRDFSDHGRGVGFFTIVAGNCVLGSQCVLIFDQPQIGVGLWVFGMVLWTVLIYAIFTGFTVKASKPSLADGINGGWLVSVVATQSVSILGELVSPHLAPGGEWLHFLSLTLWLSGGMLYIWLISLIFYRYTFFTFSPADLMPPYWINMGAMAISTLAGAVLLSRAPESPLLQSLYPFLFGFTLFFWSTATWWIPMLVILGFWRHVYRRFGLAYDPLYWGAVFPLGMYTACTYRLTQVGGLEFLAVVPRYFIYIALAAWLATCMGMFHHWVMEIRRSLGFQPLLSLKEDG